MLKVRKESQRKRSEEERWARKGGTMINLKCVENNVNSHGSPLHRYDTPIPGWMLPVVWHTEEGLPHKGILACTHAKKAASLRVNWALRVALAQVIYCCHLLLFGEVGKSVGRPNLAARRPRETEARKGSWPCLGSSPRFSRVANGWVARRDYCTCRTPGHTPYPPKTTCYLREPTLGRKS